MNMKRISKFLLVTLSIICFTSTLFGCTSNNEVTDNNETTTTAENKTTELTTTETPTTTEESTTEEPTTEYVFKGSEFYVIPDEFDLKNDLIINPGDVIYINEYVSNSSEEYDVIRGYYIKILMKIMETENRRDMLDILGEKYQNYGDSNYYIPYADNCSFEYVGEKSVIFKYIETWDNGEAVYDVYKE